MSESGDSHLSGRPLLFTGFILTGFVTTVLGPVLPWLSARWHLSDAAAGALFTIQFTGSIVAGALSGLIVARLGASTTLSTGYALMAAGFAGLALGDRVAGTLAIAVAGVGIGFVVPATNMIVARLTPHRAASALGALNFCWGIGAATWPLVVARFSPVPGVHVALLLVSSLLGVMAVRMAWAHFPIHILRPAAGSAPGTVVVGASDHLRVVHHALLGRRIGLRRMDCRVHAPADGRCVNRDLDAMGDGRVGVLGRARGWPWAGGGGLGAALRERRALHRPHARRHRDSTSSAGLRRSRGCPPSSSWRWRAAWAWPRRFR